MLSFLELILWLKFARPTVYQNMIDRYKANAQSLYEKDFALYFKSLSQRIDIDKSKFNFLIITLGYWFFLFLGSVANNDSSVINYYTDVNFFFD